MFGTGIRVGRLAGIPIGIQPLWLLVVALITWSLGVSYYPDRIDGISDGLAYGLGLISALLLFASILAHELGHALVARRYGVEIEGIDLWLLGGVAKMKGAAHHPGDELRYALAGPAVTLGIVAVFGLAMLVLPSSAPEAITAVLEYQAFVNAAILVFNLLPAFPLDGGRVLRAILWARYEDLGRATAAAATIGRGFAYVLIGLGVLGLFAGAPGVLWLGIIGVFLILAGQAEENALRMKSLLEGLGVRRTMAVPAVTVPAEISVEQAVGDYFVPYGYRSFPVVGDDGRPRGLITIDAVERLPAARRGKVATGELADEDPSLLFDESATASELAASPGFQRQGRAIITCRDGEIGILSSTAIGRVARARRLLPPQGEPDGEPRSI